MNSMLLSLYFQNVEASKIKAKSHKDVISCPEVVITICVGFPFEARSSKTSGIDYYVLGSQVR